MGKWQNTSKCYTQESQETSYFQNRLLQGTDKTA